MKNLSLSIFKYGYILTSKAKAKHLRSFLGKFITRLLNRTRQEACKYVALKINSNKSCIKQVISFYDLQINRERLTNYIVHRKVSLTHSSGNSIVALYLIKDNIS